MNACSVITTSQSLSNDCLPTELKKVEPNPAGAHARAVRHRAAAQAVASSALQAPADGAFVRGSPYRIGFQKSLFGSSATSRISLASRDHSVLGLGEKI
jgi:hypothetical protein